MKKTTDIPKLIPIEKDTLWKEACDLTDYMYDLLSQFPEEEKWESERKLRTEANEMMLAVSIACGNSSPSGVEYDWSQARKHVAGLKTIYRFSARQKFIDLDPSIMVRLSELMERIDERVKQSYEVTHARIKSEWHEYEEKYRLWSKMNHEN